MAVAAPVQAATPEPAAASPWASSGHAAARLIASGPATGAERVAAIEIRLDPGFITYWRNPGEAGLPPTLDTAASQNVAAVAVAFPAPARLDEGGATAFGYRAGVALPLQVRLADAARPAVLTVDLDYAVCSTLCLPAKAHLTLPLPGTATPEAAAAIAQAQALVPRPVALGAPGPLGIDHAAWTKAGATPELAVIARAGATAALFVEAPEGWYVDAGPPTAAGPGTVAFVLSVLQRPDGAALAGLPLRLTLVEDGAAIDTPVRMDETLPKP